MIASIGTGMAALILATVPSTVAAVVATAAVVARVELAASTPALALAAVAVVLAAASQICTVLTTRWNFTGWLIPQSKQDTTQLLRL